MPAYLNKPEEKMWKQAKAYVANSKDKSIDSFTDQDWGLVQNIFQAMKKKYGQNPPSDYPKREGMGESKKWVLKDIEAIKGKKDLADAVQFFKQNHVGMPLGSKAAFQNLIQQKAKELNVSIKELNKMAESYSFDLKGYQRRLNEVNEIFKEAIQLNQMDDMLLKWMIDTDFVTVMTAFKRAGLKYIKQEPDKMIRMGIVKILSNLKI